MRTESGQMRTSPDYKTATTTQLLTIAHHEPCTRVEQLMAMMELERRKKRVQV